MARASQEALRLRRQELGHLLELETRRFLPNTSALVGARTAARLLALAGSPAALARAPSSRLQRLGSRPRGGPQAGPKYGVLYRAEGMDRVPPARRGALARSLASMLGPALRADLITGGALGSQLADRRERRIRDLGRTAQRAPARAGAAPSHGRAGRPPRDPRRSP
jgi:RNA processing factor Prp31